MDTNLFDLLCPMVLYPPGQEQPVHILEAARRRPGMFVGSVGARGVHNMLWDILDLLVQLSPSYPDTRIGVVLCGDRTVFRSNRFTPKEFWGWDGMGLPVAAALSRQFRLFLATGERWVCRSFEQGVFTGESSHPLQADWQLEAHIRPDPEIFDDCTADYFSFYDRCCTLAALYPGITISLEGEWQRNHFCFPEGMSRLLAGFGPGLLRSERDETVSFSHEGDGVLLRCAIRKTSFPGKPLGYANGTPTPDGGTHVEGVWLGLIRAIGQSGQRYYGEPGDYVRDHYEVAVAVWIHRPLYAGAVKRRLENEELPGIVADAVQRNWTGAVERRGKGRETQ